ncbi:MAG TPA: hypothetical protein VM076_06615 [Gemmatimonadaceae bacterium]|nr:hypothetical protein [Gemmatimonadaceae bacterium]
MRAIVPGVFMAAALAGCATANMNLQRASARAIMPTPNPDSVRVSELHRGVLAARWIATTPSGVYDCSLEEPEHVPICAKRDTPR